VLGKLNRKPVERTLVQTGNKPFNYLPGKYFQRAEIVEAGLIYGNWHCLNIRGVSK
jgi:hypothetical protein